jgi:hypothetical protein
LTDARRLAAMGNGVDPDVEPGAAGRFFFQLESFDRVPRLLSTEVESLRTKAGRHRRPDGPTDPAAGQPPVDPPADPKTGPPPDDPPDPVPPAPPTPPPGFPPAQPLLAVHAILDSELLAPADDQGYPGVAGLLPVEARADGLALLAVEDGTPLLVFANRGLGRVGAWTADLLGPWGAAWVADPHFPARLAQWVRFLVPAQSAPAAVEVVEQVEVMPASVPLPREVAVWQELGGSDVRPLDSFVPPGATVETTVVGRAGDHAILGVLLLLILATAEFVRWRRPTSTP